MAPSQIFTANQTSATTAMHFPDLLKHQTTFTCPATTGKFDSPTVGTVSTFFPNNNLYTAVVLPALSSPKRTTLFSIRREKSSNTRDTVAPMNLAHSLVLKPVQGHQKSGFLGPSVQGEKPSFFIMDKLGTDKHHAMKGLEY